MSKGRIPPPGASSIIPVSQVVQSLPPTPEEWAELERRYQVALTRLERLQTESEQPLWWNRAYPVDIPLQLFSGSAAGGGYPAAFGELNIEAGQTFFALGIEAPYTVSGVLSEDDSPATLTIPESLRPLILEYTWQIRDSGTDRDWSNIPLPSQVIRTGNLGRMGMGGQARLPGGTRVMFTVNPTFFDSTSEATGLKTFESQSLQFVLSGIAVKDGVL